MTDKLTDKLEEDKSAEKTEDGALVSTKAKQTTEAVLSVSEPNHPSSTVSKQPSFALRWLSYLVAIPLIALATAGFGCISLLCGLWDRSGRQQHFIAHLWARTLLLISLSPVKIVGREKLHEHETAVYASNHLSYMDTPVLFAKLPFQFRILAKQSLWKVPFIGWYPQPLRPSASRQQQPPVPRRQPEPRRRHPEARPTPRALP